MPGQQVFDHVSLVNAARRDWETAQLYFQSVSDPDLVDHAIYVVEAAKRRFCYLLRTAREEGITAYPPATLDIL